MSLVRVGVAILAITSLSACATITRGTRQKFYVNSDPSGATVEISNNMHCTTPCVLKIHRKSRLTVNITKDGYQPVTVNVQGKMKGGGAAGMAGDAALLSPAGLGIDALTGAMLNLQPNPVSVKLVPTDAAAPATSADTSAEATPQADAPDAQPSATPATPPADQVAPAPAPEPATPAQPATPAPTAGR